MNPMIAASRCAAAVSPSAVASNIMRGFHFVRGPCKACATPIAVYTSP